MKRIMLKLFTFAFAFIFLNQDVFAQTKVPQLSDDELNELSQLAEDDYNYYGLASYLGGTIPITLSEDGKAKRIKQETEILPSPETNWIGFRGRFETVLVNVPEQGGVLTRTGFTPNATNAPHTVYKIEQDQLSSFDVNLKPVQYIQLPRVLSWVSRLMEILYEAIVALPLIGWWSGLLVLAFVMKILLWPLTQLISKWQGVANEHRNALAPLHRDIKVKLEGEEAHNAVMQTYKDRGITPFYTLKPLMATALTFPFLIGIFNMLGENAQLRDTPFLWVDSLAYPDRLLRLPFEIPFFGPYLNVFPFLMALATILVPILMKKIKSKNKAPDIQTEKMVLMAVLFFFVFYNFPSGMILYWTMVTIVPFIFMLRS